MERKFESQPRNPVIAKLFRLAHLSENLGYGLRKLKSWQEVTGMPMRIENSINSVKVIFDLKCKDTGTADEGKNEGRNEGKNEGRNEGRNLSERQKIILSLINEDASISMADIAQRIGLSISTIEREIPKMSSLIRHVGPKKGGHWEIL